MYDSLEIRCPVLATLVNSLIVYTNTTDEDSTFPFGAAGIYSCDIGYSLTGGNTTRVCVGNATSAVGAWSGNEPYCEGDS